MSGTFGSLLVKLGLNADGFSGGLSDAEKDTKKFKQNLQTHMKDVSYSTMEARHSVMILGEELGIHMPRAVSTLIASIGPVGSILAAAFPILGVVALIGIIAKAIEKHNEMKETILKNSISITEEQNKLNKAYEESALKVTELEDGKIPALVQQLTALGHASSSLGEELQTMAKDFAPGIDSSRTWTQVIEDGLSATARFVGAGTYFTGLTKKASDQVQDFAQQMHLLAANGTTAEQQLLVITKALNGLYAVRNANAPDASLNKEIEAYEAMQKAITTTVDTQFQKEKALNDNITKEKIEALKRLQEVRAAGDTAHMNALHEIQKEEEEAQSAQTMKSGTPDEKEQVSFTAANLEFVHATQIANQKLKLAQSTHDAEIKLAMDDSQKKTEADAVYANAVVAHQDALNAALMGFNKARASAIATTNREIEESNKKQMEELKKSVDELTKAEDNLASSSAKLQDVQSKSSADQGMNAIKLRVAQGVETQKEGNQEMALLYRQDAANRIEAAKAVAAQLASQEAVLQNNLAAARLDGDQVKANQAQAELDQLLAKQQENAAQQLAIQNELDNKIAELAIQTAGRTEKAWKTGLNMLNSDFGSAFANWAVKGEDFTRAMMQSFRKMELQAVQSLARITVSMLEGLAVALMTNDKLKLSNAKTAASGAYKAEVGVPIIGPVMAPIMAAAAFATAMSFDQGGLITGGLDVGGGHVLALAQPGENIMTKAQTQEVMKMTADKDKNEAQEVHNHNYGDTHIHANEAKSFESYLKRNSSALAAGIQHAVKNGHLTSRSLQGK